MDLPSTSQFGVYADAADEPAQCCVVGSKVWPGVLYVSWSTLYQSLAWQQYATERQMQAVGCIMSRV